MLVFWNAQFYTMVLFSVTKVYGTNTDSKTQISIKPYGTSSSMFYTINSLKHHILNTLHQVKWTSPTANRWVDN